MVLGVVWYEAFLGALFMTALLGFFSWVLGLFWPFVFMAITIAGGLASFGATVAATEANVLGESNFAAGWINDVKIADPLSLALGAITGGVACLIGGIFLWWGLTHPFPGIFVALLAGTGSGFVISCLVAIWLADPKADLGLRNILGGLTMLDVRGLAASAASGLGAGSICAAVCILGTYHGTLSAGHDGATARSEHSGDRALSSRADRYALGEIRSGRGGEGGDGGWP